MGEAHSSRAFQVIARDDVERLIRIAAVEQLLDRLGGGRAERCRGIDACEHGNGEKKHRQWSPQRAPITINHGLDSYTASVLMTEHICCRGCCRGCSAILIANL